MLSKCSNSLPTVKREESLRKDLPKSPFYREYSAVNLWNNLMKMFSPSKVCIEVYCDRDINRSEKDEGDVCEICCKPIDNRSKCHMCGLPRFRGELQESCSRCDNSCELSWREGKKRNLSMSSPIAICCPSQKLIQKVKHKKKANLTITKPLCCAISPSPKDAPGTIPEDYGEDECRALAYILFLLVSLVLYVIFSYHLDWWPFPMSSLAIKKGVKRFSLGRLKFR